MLFHYPRTIHRRSLSPGPFSRYQTYKKYLREEFYATCVYCRMPDTFSEKNYYAVEHYKPKKKFTILETEYSNLFYACGTCNSLKGEFWPDKKQTALNMFIPNPCDHQMYRHLRALSEGAVDAISNAGKWTSELLDLNNPDRVKKRLFILKTKKVAEKKKKELQAALKVLKAKGEPGEEPEVDKDIAQLEQELSEVENILDMIEIEK